MSLILPDERSLFSFTLIRAGVAILGPLVYTNKVSKKNQTEFEEKNWFKRPDHFRHLFLELTSKGCAWTIFNSKRVTVNITYLRLHIK